MNVVLRDLRESERMKNYFPANFPVMKLHKWNSKKESENSKKYKIPLTLLPLPLKLMQQASDISAGQIFQNNAFYEFV